MYRFSHYSILMVTLYVLAVIVMQAGTLNSWTEGMTSLPIIILTVVWSEKATHFNKEQRTYSATAAFKGDFFIIAYSIMLSFVASLIFHANNSDMKGWWVFAMGLWAVYAILGGLLFATTAKLINIEHRWYTHVFSFLLVAGFLLITVITYYFHRINLGRINVFNGFVLFLFSLHLLVCFSYQIVKGYKLNR